MKNNYSIAQRNAIVEANLWCIDSVIRQNRPLMRAARLEYDDVYQQLALRLIKAVAGYDPEKGRLEQHIFAQLKYELLSCRSAYRLCGMTGTPHSFRKSHIISIDALSEDSSLYGASCEKQGGNEMTLRDKMLAVIADVNASVAEREELVEMIAIALLTRKNLFVLGEPGQAKSYAINLFRRHITGARQFERLLSKQSDEEQLFGRVDLASLLPGSVPQTVLEQDATYQNQRFNLRVLVEGIGSMKDEPATWEKLKSGTEKLELYRAALSALHKSEPTVQTAGKIPEADIVLLDEIFKCNDGVLNSLLTALNERKYTNEGRTYPIPVISFFAASNEIPNFNDPQEKILEALYDRLELKVVTANMEDRDTRLAVLKNKQAGTFGQVTVTITLEELRQMQQEVASIPVPDAINELADDILCELRKDMAVSDRKYLGYYPIAQAKAWLSGHDKVESCDLLALKNYLWRLPSDREKVENVLNRLCVNPMQDKVNNIRGMALESQEEFDAALGDGSKADTVRKAFIKLRGELTHLYQMQCSLRTAAQSDSEIALVDDLLADLEKISRKAHEQTHFTYTTLEEIAALN